MKVVKFEFSLFGIVTYLVIDPETKECAIVDPGMVRAEEKRAMEDYIERNGLKVTDIINTHLHIDHVIGDKWAKDKYGVNISGHKDDKVLGERIKDQARMFGLPEEVDRVVFDKYLEDGEKIKIGKGELEVIHVPGHSPGSIALYDAADSFVIVGDALFSGSIGRTDLPGGSMSQLLNSIKTRLMTLPDSTIVYPGHGPATSIRQEKDGNPFL